MAGALPRYTPKFMPAERSPASRGTAVVSVACLGVAVLAVFAALNSYQVSSRNAEQYPDTYGAGRAQARLAPLLPHVPHQARLGYLTDIDPSQSAYTAALLAAQFALAPRQLVLLEQGALPEWAVGNFSKPQDFAAAGAARGYEVAGDFGNGVILYHRKSS